MLETLRWRLTIAVALDRNVAESRWQERFGADVFAGAVGAGVGDPWNWERRRHWDQHAHCWGARADPFDFHVAPTREQGAARERRGEEA